MKKWNIAIICLFFLLGCVSNSTYLQDGASTNNTYLKDAIPSGAYLEQDRWDSDRTNIKSEYGATKGYIKRDRWQSDRLNVYDRYGRPTGVYLQRDRWQPDRWNIKKAP